MEATALKQCDETVRLESPHALRMSLAAAMTLGFAPGIFHRNAKLYCVNLLLTYPSGCGARCAYCGLSGGRAGGAEKKSFIRVTWPTFSLDDIITAIATRREAVKRICISMLTNTRAVRDTKTICRRLRDSFDIPVSLLISPTVLTRQDLTEFKIAGADKIGVAIDLATPELFDRYRGSGVGGPHHWDTYWNCLTDAVDIFGIGNAGSHFMSLQFGTGAVQQMPAWHCQAVLSALAYLIFHSFLVVGVVAILATLLQELMARMFWNHAGIDPAGGDERVVCASLHHGAVHHHEDLGALPHRGQAVGHGHRDPAFPEGVEILLDYGLGPRIHGRGGFVQQQHGRIAQNRPGERNPLALAAGKLQPALADEGVVAVRQRVYDRIDAGHGRRPAHGRHGR